MVQSRALIFDSDPRVCRLLLGEALAEGFEAITATESSKLEEHYRGLAPDITFLEVDEPLARVRRFFELASLSQSGSLVLVSAVTDTELYQLKKLASGLGLKIAAILHKPMGIEAIRMVLRRQQSVTGRPQATSTSHARNHLTDGPDATTRTSSDAIESRTDRPTTARTL
jgi:DNA-binding response OmpR family regulator